jgi:hypothetical protein
MIFMKEIPAIRRERKAGPKGMFLKMTTMDIVWEMVKVVLNCHQRLKLLQTESQAMSNTRGLRKMLQVLRGSKLFILRKAPS